MIPADSDDLFIFANGAKARHFRFTSGGSRDRMYFSHRSMLSLKDGRIVLTPNQKIRAHQAIDKTRHIKSLVEAKTVNSLVKVVLK